MPSAAERRSRSQRHPRLLPFLHCLRRSPRSSHSQTRWRAIAPATVIACERKHRTWRDRPPCLASRAPPPLAPRRRRTHPPASDDIPARSRTPLSTPRRTSSSSSSSRRVSRSHPARPTGLQRSPGRPAGNSNPTRQGEDRASCIAHRASCVLFARPVAVAPLLALEPVASLASKWRNINGDMRAEPCHACHLRGPSAPPCSESRPS